MSANDPKQTFQLRLWNVSFWMQSNFGLIGRQGGIVSSSKVSEPLSQWELMQEDTERKRLCKMDDAFCASLAAAIKRGEEKRTKRRLENEAPREDQKHNCRRDK
jgi:hypothetical protein